MPFSHSRSSVLPLCGELSGVSAMGRSAPRAVSCPGRAGHDAPRGLNGLHTACFISGSGIGTGQDNHHSKSEMLITSRHSLISGRDLLISGGRVLIVGQGLLINAQGFLISGRCFLISRCGTLFTSRRSLIAARRFLFTEWDVLTSAKNFPISRNDLLKYILDCGDMSPLSLHREMPSGLKM